MAIAPFDNNDYELILSDLIADIYYSDISDGSRIVLLRKLTELLARKFLDLGVGEPMNLGDITAYEKNDKFKVTEQYNKVDKRLVKDFEKTKANKQKFEQNLQSIDKKIKKYFYYQNIFIR